MFRNILIIALLSTSSAFAPSQVSQQPARYVVQMMMRTAWWFLCCLNSCILKSHVVIIPYLLFCSADVALDMANGSKRKMALKVRMSILDFILFFDSRRRVVESIRPIFIF